MNDNKKCTKCQEIKSFHEFHKDSSRKDNLRFWCKKCTIQNVKEWTEKNSSHVKLLHKRNSLKKNYNLSYEVYNEMLFEQKQKCAICSEPGQLVVDHCHKTGKVRKLLCNRCNRVLGSVKEDEKLLLSLLEYIKNHKEV